MIPTLKKAKHTFHFFQKPKQNNWLNIVSKKNPTKKI